MQLYVEVKYTAVSETKVHCDRDAAAMMFVCGESGVRWDALNMTRAQLLSMHQTSNRAHCRGIILFKSIQNNTQRSKSLEQCRCNPAVPHLVIGSSISHPKRLDMLSNQCPSNPESIAFIVSVATAISRLP
jgi:hypothetical protein